MKNIKCVVWDLDDTLWDGVLLESAVVRLKAGVGDIIRELDGRGILQSIASKNEPGPALDKLRSFGLEEYFLAPQIGWNAKSVSIGRIGEALNLGLDTFLFVDDQAFELAEVAETLPEVRCLHAARYRELPAMPALKPRFVTPDSRRRRQMYRAHLTRQEEEERFEGPREAFLASLGMKLHIAYAEEADLQRAEELTVRTNQLNATGRTYGYDELAAFRRCADHELLICELSDRFGAYGKIGLALLEQRPDTVYLKLLLMSCRVLSHGVGGVLLGYVIQRSQTLGKRLLAEFVDTGRNRMMLVTYRFAGFKTIAQQPDGSRLMAHDLTLIAPYPKHVDITFP